MAKNSKVFTYQTRISEQESLLQEVASLLSTVEHNLYAQYAKGKTLSSCKKDFLKRFQITARQFNSCRISLEGKIAACQAGQERAILSLKQQIKTLNRKLKHLEKPSKCFVLHQKKRRQATLLNRLATLEEDKKVKRVRLCFGSKKLFNAQFHLEKNGFHSHLEWKQAWEDKRKSEFFLVGSKDETSGNQSCSLSLQEDGKLSLRLRLPKALEKEGKYIYLKNIEFAYGQQNILSALQANQAISYRFKKDAKGWRVFASINIEKDTPAPLEKQGTIGLDLNADHIAYAEIDRFGNLIETKIFPWVSYGKTKEQLKALTGDLCKKIVDLAQEAKKPIVIEKLNFQEKKSQVAGNKKFSRLLSSFAYSLFFNFLSARAFKQEVAVHEINPAYTSVIGRVNYATRYGLSLHLAAAFCIARRYLNLSEKPCSHPTIPDGKGGHVAFVLPARNRTKHVWHFWGQVKKKMTTVLAARKQAIKRSLNPISVHETANSS